MFLKYFSQYISDDSLPKPNTDTSVETIFNTLFIIIGTVAVIMVVYAGIQLILSQGNSEKVATARRSIIYAIAGLVVIISAWAIVAFIINRVST
jgi:hypothetical protein